MKVFKLRNDLAIYYIVNPVLKENCIMAKKWCVHNECYNSDGAWDFDDIVSYELVQDYPDVLRSDVSGAIQLLKSYGYSVKKDT